MHIICLQKYLVQTTNRQIVEKLMLFLFKRVNISTSQAKGTKKIHSLLYFEMKSWFLQYLIVMRYKMIIGLFLRIKIVAFNVSGHKIIKGFLTRPSVFICNIAPLM